MLEKDPSLDRVLLCVRAAIEKKAENIKILQLPKRVRLTE